MIRRARLRKAPPSSVSVNRRVVRCNSLAPSARSRSASLSLTTDFESRSRRAASLIEPASLIATNMAIPSSFIIVRKIRKIEPIFAD
jgi:hypothetical protein